MARVGAPSSSQGQRLVEVNAKDKEPAKETPNPHLAVVAAYQHGLDGEGKERFNRGVAKRRANFQKYAEDTYIDALDSVSALERMEALRRIIAMFEPDPEATTDDTVFDLQIKTVNAILDMLKQEDMPKAQALCFRALVALYPMSPTVEPPAPKDPKEKPKSKFAATPKRVPPGHLKNISKASVPVTTSLTMHPRIVERNEDPTLSSVLDTALKYTGTDVAWYVRIMALRLVSRLAPWTIILGFAARKEEPNAESSVADLAKMASDEVDDRIRYSLIQTIFKMQVFLHLMPRVRGPIVISLADRLMLDPCMNIRMLILRELGPLVNTDPYASEPCDKVALSTILCTFHDESLTMRCMAMEMLAKIVPKKDDQSVLSQVMEQIKDLKMDSFTRRRFSAAQSIPPQLGKAMPTALLLPSSAAVSPREKRGDEDALPAPPPRKGRELSVLILLALASQGNKQVIHDTVKLLTDEDHYVRLAAAKVLGKLAPDYPATVTLVLKLIEGAPEQEKKTQTQNAPSTKTQQATQKERNQAKMPAQQVKVPLANEPEKKGRQWKDLMGLVYAVQLIVQDGPARNQMLKEIVRLCAHSDGSVRQAVVEIMQTTPGAEDVIKTVLPLLKSEIWGAREVAVQVIGGVLEKGQYQHCAPLFSCLSDTSWTVRHEAALSLIKLLEGCTDPAKFKLLIKAAAPEAVRDKELLGEDGLMQHIQRSDGETFVLALDVLRVVSECDADLRQVLGGMLKSELRISAASERSPSDVCCMCEGTWLLRQPVSEGVVILLESHKSRQDALARSRSDLAQFHAAEAADIFCKSISKFKSAAAAKEVIQELLDPDESMDLSPSFALDAAAASSPRNHDVDASSVQLSSVKPVPDNPSLAGAAVDAGEQGKEQKDINGGAKSAQVLELDAGRRENSEGEEGEKQNIMRGEEDKQGGMGGHVDRSGGAGAGAGGGGGCEAQPQTLAALPVLHL